MEIEVLPGAVKLGCCGSELTPEETRLYAKELLDAAYKAERFDGPAVSLQQALAAQGVELSYDSVRHAAANLNAAGWADPDTKKGLEEEISRRERDDPPVKEPPEEDESEEPEDPPTKPTDPRKKL